MARKNSNTDLVEVISIMEPDSVLDGKSFCISGHLSKPRKEIQNLIRGAGGKVENTITWNLDYLITNNDFSKGVVSGNKSLKIKKAETYGVKIISEDDFLKMISIGSLS